MSDELCELCREYVSVHVGLGTVINRLNVDRDETEALIKKKKAKLEELERQMRVELLIRRNK